ncbi:MAG: hypothetical protein ABFD25_22155 [Clostridiaceae bacterium]
MLALKIIAGVILLTGFGTVLGAKNLVKRFNLNQKTSVKFENEMNEEEIEQYKQNKAIVNVKLVGMLIALPGIVLTLIVFR